MQIALPNDGRARVAKVTPRVAATPALERMIPQAWIDYLRRASKRLAARVSLFQKKAAETLCVRTCAPRRIAT
jgi:hypothetical protein